VSSLHLIALFLFSFISVDADIPRHAEQKSDELQNSTQGFFAFTFLAKKNIALNDLLSHKLALSIAYLRSRTLYCKS